MGDCFNRPNTRQAQCCAESLLSFSICPSASLSVCLSVSQGTVGQRVYSLLKKRFLSVSFDCEKEREKIRERGCSKG